jgi:glycine hydroxymethyltransferase
VHYTIDENERLDYDAIRALALEHKPKLMIAGYSSYSWVPDWKKFREIADEVGAYFLADISHIGGLVAAGVIPSPIGHAHVVMSTTHKSIDGPRGAVLLTTDAAIAKKIDKAVFPGEQGGPHVNVFAALALTFKLTQTKQFKQLQAQTLKNAKAMADQFTKRGLRVPFGGTDTHLVNVDCTSIIGEDGTRNSAATRLRASWTSSAWWSTATPSPATGTRWTRAESALARRGSHSAASTRRRPVNWRTSWRMC